eukprot:85787-Pyramimonas_sp.AAC.1
MSLICNAAQQLANVAVDVHLHVPLAEAHSAFAALARRGALETGPRFWRVLRGVIAADPRATPSRQRPGRLRPSRACSPGSHRRLRTGAQMSRAAVNSYIC